MIDGGYRLLTQVDITHEYYSDHVFRDLSIWPLSDTANVMNRYGLLLKASDHGFKIYYSQDFDVNQLATASKRYGSLRISLGCTNQWFQNFTDSSYDQLEQFEFDNEEIVDRQGEHWLISNIQAGEAGQKGIATVTLHLHQFIGEAGIKPGHYRINFTPRSSQWNYYVFGAQDHQYHSLAVKDEAGHGFKGPIEQNKFANREALLFSSGDKEYPMLERPQTYCALYTTSGTHQHASLLKTLPSASVSSISGVETLGRDRRVVQSSIYIYI